MGLTTYGIDTTSTVVKYTEVDFVRRTIPHPIHLMQYDDTGVVVGVELYSDNEEYACPSGVTSAHLRISKPDGTYIYLEAAGVSSDRKTMFFIMTQQTTVVPGDLTPVLELKMGTKIAQSGYLHFIIDKNPIPQNITSTSVIDGISSGGSSGTTSSVTVDSVLSTTSENPVQNKVITAKINEMDNVYTYSSTTASMRLKSSTDTSAVAQVSMVKDDDYGSITAQADDITLNAYQVGSIVMVNDSDDSMSTDYEGDKIVANSEQVYVEASNNVIIKSDDSVNVNAARVYNRATGNAYYYSATRLKLAGRSTDADAGDINECSIVLGSVDAGIDIDAPKEIEITSDTSVNMECKQSANADAYVKVENDTYTNDGTTYEDVKVSLIAGGSSTKYGIVAENSPSGVSNLTVYSGGTTGVNWGAKDFSSVGSTVSDAIYNAGQIKSAATAYGKSLNNMQLVGGAAATTTNGEDIRDSYDIICDGSKDCMAIFGVKWPTSATNGDDVESVPFTVTDTTGGVVIYADTFHKGDGLKVFSILVKAGVKIRFKTDGTSYLNVLCNGINL